MSNKPDYYQLVGFPDENSAETITGVPHTTIEQAVAEFKSLYPSVDPKDCTDIVIGKYKWLDDGTSEWISDYDFNGEVVYT